ncbi:hypothetical protein WJX73_003889 [Symbiochloris irregularis]|uniref:DNA polymerase delta subunit 3 n=1 Tax=Symbiochloris irregularis TaxID=706552 RepID=A0AAW1P236_9CHLO
MKQPRPTDILKEVESLVCEELKAISFKWLARHFDIPASLAKQLLFSYTEKHRDRVCATYLVAGWTKEQCPRHVVQLVGQKCLQKLRSTLKKETSLHVYSIQPSQPKDPAELWNSDYLQSKDLLSACSKDQKANALVENRASAIACKEAKWDPKEQIRTAHKAPPAPASQQAAALKTAVDKIVSGKTLRSKTGGTVSITTDDDPNAPKPSERAGREEDSAAATTTGSQRAGNFSGAAKRAALVSGDKRGAGNSGLAAMWNKAPAKKPRKEAAGASAPRGRAAAAAGDANDALRLAQEQHAEEGTGTSSDSEGPVAPMRRVRHGNNRSRQALAEDEDEGDDIEVDIEAPRARPAAAQRVLEESSDDDSMQGAPAPSARAYKELTDGEKASAAAQKRTRSASRAEGEADEAHDSAATGKASKRAKRSKPQPKYGSVKASDAPADAPPRRKVLKSIINDKGEEVTELVWEDEPGGSDQPEPEPEAASADGTGQQGQEEAAAPASKAVRAAAGGAAAAHKKPQSRPPADAGKKGAKGSKGKAAAGSKSIQSFFAKKS